MSYLRAWRDRRAAEQPDDAGFSLVEAVVALFVLALVTSALAATMISGVRASLISRQNQQAADFMTRALEVARQKDFASLGHVATDLPGGDSRVTSCGTGKCVTPGTTAEKLFVTTGASHPTHVETVTSNGTAFTVATYVTEVAGKSPDELKRVTVMTSWTSFGTTRTRKTSSLVTMAQRGLPLPRYVFTTPQTTVTANPGARLQMSVRLFNQGAPDRWNLSLSGTAASYAWALYHDKDGNGVLSSGDTALTDTNADGTIDTGRIDPGSAVPVVVVYDSSTSDATGTRTLTVTATSVGQPTAAGAVKSLSVGVTLTTGAVTPTTAPTATPTATPTSSPVGPAGADCPWTGAVPAVVLPTANGNGNQYTNTTYALHNGTSGGAGDTAAQSVSAMDLTAVPTRQLAAMSTDINATAAGRTVNPAVAATPTDALLVTDPKKFVDWKLSTGGSAVDVGGTAVLKLWVGPTSGSLANVPLRVVVYQGVPGGGATSLGSWSGTIASSCSGWQLLYVSVPLTADTVPKNSQFGVRVVNTGSQAVRFAYDAVVSPPSGTSGYAASFGVGVR